MTSCADDAPDYEAQFARRFTAEDGEYQEYLRQPSGPPPMVEGWRGRGGGRDSRFQERRPYRGHDRGHGWRWGGDQRSSQHWHDRRWGEAPGPQNSYSQGYNSYNQRRHYERY
ncbi:RNA guanine-N7 methyltransferase activating subunit-like [Denticeps clupeoides]|uniref:RAM protein n=1 Tax=Denticeps clupeoides TaxID=299321 RepID=A0AAY4DFC2_9TELE|nr:RNA guanine-N7 methyltransferase activating subunit [Denticeps clupeoides]XP_028812914.1 RNA guanine-N7 methyltransferase activating subunit [Denticeps clupeoides]